MSVTSIADAALIRIIRKHMGEGTVTESEARLRLAEGYSAAEIMESLRDMISEVIAARGSADER